MNEQEKVEWSGEGLPPVGVECESRLVGEGYRAGSLKYKSERMIVWQDSETGDETANRPEHREFRPLETEAEKELDQLIGDGVNTVEYYSGLANPTLESAVRILVQSGWRPQKATQ